MLDKEFRDFPYPELPSRSSYAATHQLPDGDIGAAYLRCRDKQLRPEEPHIRSNNGRSRSVPESL